MRSHDHDFMQQAISLAEKAEQLGEVPVGAVLVLDNQIIAEGYNCPISSHDPTAHAEIVTLRKAGLTLQNYRLPNTTLYVTLEPCAMCMGALIHARVGRLVFGAVDPKAGASELQLPADRQFNHQMDIQSGCLADQCGELLTAFFKKRR